MTIYPEDKLTKIDAFMLGTLMGIVLSVIAVALVRF